MTTEDMGFGIIPDPMLVNTESGEPTYAAQRAKEDTVAAQRENEWTLLDEGLTTNNTIYDVAVTASIDLGTEPEEGFDPLKLPGLFDNIPPEFHKRLAGTSSTVEAWAQRAHIESYLENADKLAASGWSGVGAQLAAGLIDADALLIPVTGGSYLAPKLGATLAKTGLKDGRIASTLTGAAAGVEAGAITGVVGATAGINTQAGDIPGMILGGMAFGSTIGAVVGKGGITQDMQLKAAKAAHEQYVDSVEAQFKADQKFRQSSKSAGSAQIVPEAPATLRESTKKWYNRAAEDTNAASARKVLTGELDAETTNIDNLIGRTAQRAQNWVDKSPMKSLYTSVSDMGTVGNKLAYDLLYHPGGMLDGAAHPAAGLDYMYQQDLSLPIQNYSQLAMDYMGRPRDKFRDKVSNAFVRKSDYRLFDKAVREELEARYHDGIGNPNVHKSVKEMADLLDDMHAKAISIQQGRAGETGVNGAENLKPKSGYYHRKWSGESMAKYDQNAIIAAIKDGYTKLLPPGSVVDPKILDSIARSIVTRAKAMEEGIDTNLIGLLRDGGKEFLRDTLKNNKISDEQIDSLLTAFIGNAEERAKPGFLKGRIELDLRTPIPGTDAKLLDLLEPDMYKSMHTYVRKVAGTSAMARKGYQLGDKTELIESIKDELVAQGKRADDPRIDDMLETVFSYFGAGTVGKGVDPLLLSSMRLTRQSLLGTLGLTQLSELGNVVSLVGVEAAIKIMPKELKAALSGKKTPLIQELHDAFIFMDKDHILNDDELALDITGKSSIMQTEFMDKAYKTVAFGDKLSGYTSLFYQAMTYSQRLALSAVNHKLYQTLSKGDLGPGELRRLLDLGLDETMANKLQKYINKGTIKMEGDELTLGLNKWDAADLEDYKLAMHQFVSRAVQKNLPGELPHWMTKQFGQFITQLRAFPIMAAQKQFLRNMRHADNITSAAMLWNLGVAGMIYSVTETIKGRGDDLTPEKIAKGAINYSPMTGWMPMMTDPLAEVMGMPELRMNQYGPPGRATEGIIPVPPAFPTLNRMMHIPGAALGSLNGIDRQEAVSLSSIPIVGNTYGFSYMFNRLKDEEPEDNKE